MAGQAGGGAFSALQHLWLVAFTKWISGEVGLAQSAEHANVFDCALTPLRLNGTSQRRGARAPKAVLPELCEEKVTSIRILPASVTHFVFFSFTITPHLLLSRGELITGISHSHLKMTGRGLVGSDCRSESHSTTVSVRHD